jgi:hypothetical protein
MIFDIDPDKTCVRVPLGQTFEFGLILFAGIAPRRAKTQHQRDIVCDKSLSERRGIRKIASHVSTRQNDCL